MKKIVLFVILGLSLLANFYLYSVIKEPKIASMTTPTFIPYGKNEISIRFGGYVKWNDPSKQPESIRQFFSFNIEREGDFTSCHVIDIWDRNDLFSGSYIAMDSKPANCKVLQMTDSDATVEYRDLKVIVNKQEALIISNTLGETGGAKLVYGPELTK